MGLRSEFNRGTRVGGESRLVRAGCAGGGRWTARGGLVVEGGQPATRRWSDRSRGAEGVSNWVNHLGVFCTWTTIFIYMIGGTTRSNIHDRREVLRRSIGCMTDNYARMKDHDC